MTIFNISSAPEPSEREYLIDGLIYKGEISLLYGPSGVGKSALLVDMLARVSMKVDVSGKPTVEADIFWFPTEGISEHHRRLKTNLKQLSSNTSKYGQHYMDDRPLALIGSNVKEYLSEVAMIMIAEGKVNRRPQIMVVDTLNQAMAGYDENSSSAMSEVISNLKYLLTLVPDLHILIVHHSGKKKEYGPRGHSSLFAAMDSCFFLSSLKDRQQLEVIKQRGSPAGEKLKFKLLSIDTAQSSSVGIEYC